MPSEGPRQVADSRPHPAMAGPRVACSTFVLTNQATVGAAEVSMAPHTNRGLHQDPKHESAHRTR